MDAKTQDLNPFASSQEVNKNLYREQLQIESVQEVTDFKSGANVLQWKTMNREGKITVVGRQKDALVLIQEDGNGSYVEVQVLSFPDSERCVIL